MLTAQRPKSVGIQDVIASFKEYSKKVNEKRILKAFDFANLAHRGQLRKTGEPYIIHPLNVAYILSRLRVDEDTIIAGLLHDVPEDTPKTLSQIEQEFGSEVAYLVNGVTKLSKVQYKHNMKEHQIESLRKMFLVMARDLRVVLIKLCDRLHNMETLYGVRQEKRLRIAKETLEIFAPLADRLGIWQLKWLLEDLCFQNIHPEEYEILAKTIQQGQTERERYIERIVVKLKRELGEAGITVSLSGRTKHLYSIYQKMLSKKKPLDEIYDIFAVRAVVSEVKDCYAVLGIIHDLWKPKPGRFKDYIAVPKANGYQSLHTTVFCLDGKLTEFQIRTHQMHEQAEYGIPAHWHYSASKSAHSAIKTKVSKAPRDQMEWVKNLAEMQEALTDNQEFLDSLKIDIFKDRIFVFTPAGDVKDLPVGSTCVDFAYAIHTNLGHSCIGTKVNGSIAPLSTVLKTGDVVEVMSTKVPAGPKRDWLNFVVTSQAANKIRSWFRNEDREKNLKRGVTELNKELSRFFKTVRAETMSNERKERALEGLPYKTFEDVLVRIGEGSLTPIRVVKKMYAANELFAAARPRKESVLIASRRGAAAQILIAGEHNVLTKFAHCCAPIPGDKIVGYVTRGGGVTVHTLDCSELDAIKDRDRLLFASWRTEPAAAKAEQVYEVKIVVEGQDRVGMMRDMMTLLAEMNVNVSALTAKPIRKTQRFHDELTLEINDLEQLRSIFEALERIPGVASVRRR